MLRNVYKFPLENKMKLNDHTMYIYSVEKSVNFRNMTLQRSMRHHTLSTHSGQNTCKNIYINPLPDT